MIMMMMKPGVSVKTGLEILAAASLALPWHCTLELRRYRFSFFWSFFSKVGIGFGIGFQNIAISVSVFGFSTRTYHCLSNNTIADTLYALPFLPNGVWALEFALQIAAIRDSDIVTIDNL